MAFTLQQFQPSGPSEYPFNDLIGKILGGYTEGTNAQFLRPKLEEELKKAKLYNEYYGPNIESQIGLRGAQAENLGSLTQSQNITNSELRQRLHEQLLESKLYNKYYGLDIESQMGLRGAQAENLGSLTQNQNITNMELRQRLNEELLKSKLYNKYYGLDIESQMGLRGAQAENLGSLTQNQNITNMELRQRLNEELLKSKLYNKYYGLDIESQMGLRGAQAENLGSLTQKQNYFNQLVNSNQQEGQPPPIMDNNQGYNPMQPTNQDIINKNYFGIDTFTPRVQAQLEQQKKLTEEQQKLEANDIHGAQLDLPKLQKTADALERLIKITNNPKNEELFGHSGLFGLGSDFAANRFTKTTTNPAAGEFQNLILSPIMNVEQELSQKGNQLALKTALGNKANFSEQQPVALAKLKSALKEINTAIEKTKKIANKKFSYSPNDMVRVETPDGIKVMKYSEAISLGAE